MSKVLAEASNIGTGSDVAQRQRRVMFSNGAEGNQNEAVHVDDGSGESGVNSPLAGKRCPTRASSERAKKSSSTKPRIVLGRTVRKKSAS